MSRYIQINKRLHILLCKSNHRFYDSAYIVSVLMKLFVKYVVM